MPAAAKANVVLGSVATMFPAIFAIRLAAIVTVLPAAGAASASPAAAIVGQKPLGARSHLAAVSEAAPVYLRPDASLIPLRQLPAGATVTVGQVRDSWVQITFDDSQFGRRTGWIESRFVTLYPPDPAVEPPEVPSPEPGEPQETAPFPAPRPSNPVGFRGFGTVAYDQMAAADSFEATFGTRAAPSYGGGLQVTNIWRGLFVEVSAERSRLKGERVFVADSGTVFPLGIPLEVTMTPFEVVGGWRFGRAAVATPYAGAGFTSMAYKETSDFADADENVDERYTGWVVMGGVEVKLMTWLHVRGEARYRLVPDALGVGGVSAAFNETKLGGFGGALKIVVGR